MKEKTVEKFIKHLEKCKELGLTKKEYEEQGHVSKGYFYQTYFKLSNNPCETSLHTKATRLYEELSKWCKKSTTIPELQTVSVEMEDDNPEENTTYVERDEDEKIVGYYFDISIKDKAPLKGMLTREEMNSIYRMYSAYGSNITQREVSRFFPELSLMDFKRVMRAFNITKASAQFAPHMIEEHTIEELKLIGLREKENNLLTSIEQEVNRNNAKAVKDLTRENQKLKNFNQGLEETIVNFLDAKGIEPKIHFKNPSSADDILILHLADLHIGAKVSRNSLYDNEYNYTEIERRLAAIIEHIPDRRYSKIVVNLLGDMLDGMDNRTTRRDHELPQNMDNYEQINNYLSLMETFFTNLDYAFDCPIEIYSTKCGNHDGVAAYAATKALLYKLEYTLGIKGTIFDQFFGAYKERDHTFIICHGKDDQFMKRNLPINLDSGSKVKIYDWLEDNQIYGRNIHFIKGDLHNENLNTSYKFDYRNVLSVFGSSDYAQLNFERVNYGVSYELLMGNQILRGTFTDL